MKWTRFLGSNGRDTLFDVLVQTAWADGRLAPDEIAAAHAAASALGLSASGASTSLMARGNRPFESLALASLGPLERPFVYGTAAWTTMADRHVTISEHLLMRKLRGALGISGPFAASIESWAAAERLDARDAPEHGLELDRVMGRITGYLLGAPT